MGLIVRLGFPLEASDLGKPDDSAPDEIVAAVSLYRQLDARGLLSPDDAAATLYLLREPIVASGRGVLARIRSSDDTVRARPQILAIADRRYVWLSDHPTRYDLWSWQPIETLPTTREGVTYDVTGLLVDAYQELTKEDSDVKRESLPRDCPQP